MEILLYTLDTGDILPPQLWKYDTAAAALKDYEKTIVYKRIEVIHITKDGKPISLDELKILNLLTR